MFWLLFVLVLNLSEQASERRREWDNNNNNNNNDPLHSPRTITIAHIAQPSTNKRKPNIFGGVHTTHTTTLAQKTLSYTHTQKKSIFH